MTPHTTRTQPFNEQRLSRLVFITVAAMMVIRAAQQFSGGALVMSSLLGPVWFPRFEIITGLGLGLGSEMLMTLAGRNWRNWLAQLTEISARSGLTRIQRTSYQSEARRNATYAKRFMYVGAASSLYSGVGFLLSNSSVDGHINLGQALLDLVTCAVITAVILYIGVFAEFTGPDETQATLAELDRGMDAALAGAVDRFRHGTHTDTDVRFIAEHLPPHRQAKFRRAVAKQNSGRMWKASQVREALGMGNDARAIRDLNRQVNLLARTPENGLNKEDGRTWLIPHAVVMDTWGEQMAEYTALRRIGAPLVSPGEVAERPAVGQSEMSLALPPTPAPGSLRAVSDERTTLLGFPSGPTGLANPSEA